MRITFGGVSLGDVQTESITIEAKLSHDLFVLLDELIKRRIVGNRSEEKK